MKNAVLMKVSVEDNRNFYFNMIQVSENRFNTEFGRVGAPPIKKPHPMRKWDEVYSSKISEGFVDKTDLCLITTTQKIDSNIKTNIKNPVIRDLVERLIRFAKNEISRSYSVTTIDVTDELLKQAQEKINRFVSCKGLEEFNQILLDLFALIPRKMEDPKKYLLKDFSIENIEKIVQREQELLDVLKGEVKRENKEKEVSFEKTSILDSVGISIRECSDAENLNIRSKMGRVSSHFKKAYRVYNRENDKLFEKYCEESSITEKDIHYFYHGSKNQNFWNIITSHLSLNPNAPITGKMFGYGIYFANRAAKSIGYTSLPFAKWNNEKSKTGFLAVYKVAYKNPLHVYEDKSEYRNYHYQNIAKKGYDALFAHQNEGFLLNDEIIVYKEEQATLCYLIELE